MLLIHGDNIIQSRQFLTDQLTQAKTASKEIHHLLATTLQLKDLTSLVGTASLFGGERLIVIEELHSLPKSTKKEELIAAIAKIEDPGTELILWEKRALTPTMLKKFTGAKVQEFKTSNTLFKWLDTLNGQKRNHSQQLELFHQTVQTDGEFMCFSMLARQIRLLIQVKEGSKVAGPPFVVTKLKRQADTFSLDQLLKIHQHLHDFDVKQKTSTNALSLEKDLDLLFLNL